jgi:hypothetical protein
MKERVFVSGPIQGMETRQDYRETLRELLARYGYEPVDPWKREKVLYRGPLKNGGGTFLQRASSSVT